jgi:indole-3-glycerol phosphate synthase
VDDVLKKIYAAKARHLEREMSGEPYEELQGRALASVASRRHFLAALRQQRGSALVAEIKRASPTAGLIAREFDPSAIARRYEDAGADAISVLTESDHFLGDISFLAIARAATNLPILRKDFLSTPYQVAQSAAYGADAALLIVGALADSQLAACLEEAHAYKLDALIEVHDAKDLDRAVRLGAQCIGVNNRNLRTMITDLAVSEHLLPSVPDGVFAISESGMRDLADIERLRSAGAHGFLIGETLMRLRDPGELITAVKRVYAH